VTFDQKRLKVMSKPKETRSAEFLALNHRGKTPVLVDGDTVINESLAILFYIEDYFAPNIPLLPPITEKIARARTLARIQETENLHRVYDELEDSHFDGANNITPPLSAERRAELIADIEAELHFWEKYAGEHGEKLVSSQETSSHWQIVLSSPSLVICCIAASNGTIQNGQICTNIMTAYGRRSVQRRHNQTVGKVRASQCLQGNSRRSTADL
jgi:hypothetical protein